MIAEIAMDMPGSHWPENIKTEMTRLLAARQFARAPVMRRLLGYLISKSLAGEGEALKAYIIAVDALGKMPNFDAQSDSYPRVQVGRLRALLDAFYKEHGVENGVRFAIPKGGYRVTFDAVPDDASSAVDALPDLAVPLAATVPAQDSTSIGGLEMMRLGALAMGMAVIIFLLWQNVGEQEQTQYLLADMRADMCQIAP